MNDKKVIAFLGSPRHGGNSDVLLDEALAGVEEAGASFEKFVLNDLSMRPCQGCESCHKTGVCRIEDDFQELYRRLRDNSLFILASPVYFSGVSAQTKILLDRCQCCWAARFVLNRPIASPGLARRGFILGVGAMEGKERFSAFLAETQAFFAVNNIHRMGELLVDGVDAKGKILKKKDALEEARSLGRRLVLGI
ncbi:MAG: flavodoxin family protein [Dehalococcoidales bacterium]|nr:flavodoxin family protein [Dehalococcoidales bacterium]